MTGESQIPDIGAYQNRNREKPGFNVYFSVWLYLTE